MTERVMYDAVCDTCDVALRVPFKPDGVRPVLCKEHRAESQRGGPKKQAASINLYQDTSGKVQVKFFFTSKDCPVDVPEEEERAEPFPVDGGQRQDNGTCVIDAQDVAADFIRTGLANADGHQWKLVFVGKWRQRITNPAAREKYGEFQWVVKLTYVSNPKPEEVYYAPRRVRDAIRELAKLYMWHVRVWQNDFGPCTINFTSPKGGEVGSYLVVRDGCVVLEKAGKEQVKAAEGPTE